MSRTLHVDLLLWKRFIDDVLVVCMHTSRRQLLSLLNSWCPGIIVTNDEGDNNLVTNFLDLRISIAGSQFVYETFRIPLNAYAYLPFSSNHSYKTKSGIVSTEAFRLLVTNRYQNSYDAQVRFCTRKLCDRGYPRKIVLSLLERFPWHMKEQLLSRRSFQKVPVVPFKLCFTPLLKDFKFGCIVRSYIDILDDEIRKRLQFVMCYTSDPNLFRLHYGRFI